MKKPDKKSFRLSRLILWVSIMVTLPGAACGGVIGDLREEIMLRQLSGEGQFVVYQRDVPSKDPLFPLEVIGDGYKMVRIYKDMDSYRVEWTWRVTLRNKTAREMVIALDYRLQDGDGFLVTASQESSRKIAPGESVSLEKTDSLSYEQAKRVMGSSWDIQLLN
jgi:hypothetical protein